MTAEYSLGGWSRAEAGGKLISIRGQDVYWHKGRATFAIERDHTYLQALNDGEGEILAEILLFSGEHPRRDVQLGLDEW